ncbi:MAG TPA: TlpA disulfide reductase family protein [SAR202 cluster bacterium]|jgi:cytochrome c biogenesis protein CcmG/thiol:disulfide interchange protein DsbE|nr:TlpA disulfide reductase family protein [SAR202 cluster bacterium]HJO81300.1 TlpA disulfide reductase family protein [SAR202 cluster bacterium]|tara:strand:- start:1835 stop:2434 length:600 start_codon:yes stop_codon:yes gene_type:complete
MKLSGKKLGGIGGVSVLAVLFVGLMVIGLTNKEGPTGRSGITRVGKPAETFSMPLIGGGTFDASQHLGKPMVLNFWASWCPPCRQESPGLERTWRAFEDTEIVFVGVDIQDEEDIAQAYVNEFGLTFPNGRDPDGTITVDYGVIGLPVTFFVSAEGVVEGRWVGAISESKLVDWVEALLEGMTPSSGPEGETPGGFQKF